MITTIRPTYHDCFPDLAEMHADPSQLHVHGIPHSTYNPDVLFDSKLGFVSSIWSVPLRSTVCSYFMMKGGIR